MDVFSVLVLIIVLAIVFLLLRQVNLWYWRINRALELLEKIENNSEILRSYTGIIARHITKDSSNLDETDETRDERSID